MNEEITEIKTLEEKPTKKKDINWNTILIFIMLAAIICINVFVASKVLKHYEEFSSNPILYGAKKYELSSCSCIADNGGNIYFNKTSIWTIRKNKPFYEYNKTALEEVLKNLTGNA